MTQITRIVDTLLDAGLSVIPITMPEKRPSVAWKQYQEHPPQKGSLPYLDTNGVALICGHVSGNVEVIDVDIKNDPTLADRFDEVIASFCPDVIAEGMVTIQRTISGGLHIVYKCEQISGNMKLAKDEAGLCLIETRGEGGYIVIAPTPGYSVILGQLENIPTLTIDERTRLLDACRALNKYFQKTYTPKEDATHYTSEDNTPGNDYNSRGKLEDLIEPLGWSFSHTYKNNQYWRRPDKKVGHSASWNGTVFFIWSSSTKLEPEKGYNLFQLRTYLQFGGDFSACAKQLASEGYGSPAVRRDNKSVNDENWKGTKKADPPAPAEDGDWLKQHVFLIPSMVANNRFAHVLVDDNKVCYYFESNGTGKSSEPLRHKLATIKGEDSWPKFTNEGLSLFDEGWIQKDTMTECYIYFRNGTVKVTSDSVTFMNGSDRQMIWASLVLDRDYAPTDQVHEIAEIARQATVDYKKLQIGLGYLMHRYWRRNAAKIVWAVDHKPQSKNDGRRGKDLLTALVSLCRKWTPVKWKSGHNFWTSSIQPDTAIVHFEDVDSKLSVDDEMKRSITGDLNIEHKGANIITRKFNDKPKFSATSQSMPFDYMDSSIRGRIWLIEFTDYLQKNPPKNVLVYDDKNLNSFDAWMIDCVQVYLKNFDALIGCPPITPEQRDEMYRLMYGPSIVKAVKEMQSKLYALGWVPSEELFELLDCTGEDKKTITKFKAAYEKITGGPIERIQKQELGKKTWGYKQENSKAPNQAGNAEIPF
jgi:hypothetical protein